MIQVRFAGCTDRGQVRERNEDSYLAQPPVFIVADGMGGHSGGDQASQAAVAAFSKLTGREFVEAEEVLAAVAQAGVAVAGLYGGTRPPGSTLAGVAMTRAAGRPCWLVFNVGDSRTHLLRDRVFTQISVDHSAAAHWAEAPKNIITRALGAGIDQPEADQWLIPARPGDLIVVCSDGLSNEVSAQVIAETVVDAEDLQDAANQLIELALQSGGRDNVTAVLVRCDSVEAGKPATMDEGRLPPRRDHTIRDREDR